MKNLIPKKNHIFISAFFAKSTKFQNLLQKYIQKIQFTSTKLIKIYKNEASHSFEIVGSKATKILWRRKIDISKIKSLNNAPSEEPSANYTHHLINTLSKEVLMQFIFVHPKLVQKGENDLITLTSSLSSQKTSVYLKRGIILLTK